MNSPMGRTQSVREITDNKNNNKCTQCPSVWETQGTIWWSCHSFDPICALPWVHAFLGSHTPATPTSSYMSIFLLRPTHPSMGLLRLGPKRDGDLPSVHIYSWRSLVGFQLKQRTGLWNCCGTSTDSQNFHITVLYCYFASNFVI